MGKENKIQLFQDQKVRTHWDEEQEKWYFSVIDVVAVLAENPRPRKYWNDLKKKLKDEGSELSEKIGQLKMPAQAGKTVKNYKKFKNLKKEDLRDNMSNLELVLNMLAEASTTEISKEKKPKDLDENKDVARKGGNAAKQARLEIEKQTGKPIVTGKNAHNLLDDTQRSKKIQEAD